jgi:hypothetical protein
MAKLWCREGEHEVKVAMRPAPGERWCPDHPECHLAEKPKKRSAGFRADRETPARRSAREAFNRAVKAHRCFYSAYRAATGKPRREGHRCTYPLDAHHIVEKRWIEDNFPDLSEAELLAILFDPRIGAPLCRSGHDAVKSLRIFWDEVSDECKEACREVDRQWLDVPTPAGVRRKSMYAELRRACPPRSQPQQAASVASEGAR